MPVFTLERPRIKPKKTRIKLDQKEVKVKIEEKVRNFEERMSSMNYHAFGGCDIAIINDGSDCGSCPG